LNIPKIVIADANVLISGTARDFLLNAALDGMLEVFWSQYILDETERNAPDALGMTAEQAKKLVAALNANFPYALLEVPEYSLDLMSGADWSRDPKDLPVAAAAQAAGADAIVTKNVRHFPWYG
jgi:predicted nucleic acid-binding protein